MNQFYMLLPSNTPEFGNKSNNFRVRLPHTINLEGDWEVALVEFVYPYSWNNLQGVVEDGSLLKDNGIYYEFLNGTVREVLIPPTNYETINDLLGSIIEQTIKEGKVLEQKIKHEKLTNPNIKDDDPRLYLGIGGGGVWTFDYITKRVRYEMPTNILRNVKLSKKLQYMMGFEKNDLYNGIHIAEHAVDMKGAFDTLYVYCSIIENQIVGNTKVPLLRSVNNTTGNFGELVERMYNFPYYIPVLKNELSVVEISIKGDDNKHIPFEFGKTIVKLHFRKRKFH